MNPFSRCTRPFYGSLLVFALAPPAHAQQKPVATPADYGQWETLGGATLSPDGAWLAYAIRRVNEENELRIRGLTVDTLRVVAYGTNPVFSSDSRWLAYAIGVSAEERERLQAEQQPVRNSVGVVDLRTGGETTFEAVASFGFSPDGAYVAMQAYPPQDSERQAADLLVRDLVGGTTSNFGNVSGFAWADRETLLALTIETESGPGNGVHLYNPESGTLRVLESSEAVYRGLAWREDETDLAVLRSREDEGFEEDTHLVLAWYDLDSGRPRKVTFDPDTHVDAALRVAEQRPLAWSDDGSSIFFGLRPRERAPEEPAEASPDSAESADSTAAAPEPEEKSDVQVWHANDFRIQPMQEAQEAQDLRRTLLAAWDPEPDTYQQLGTDLMENTQVLEGGRYVTETDGKPHRFSTMFGRRYTDVYLLDRETGERRPVLDGVRYFYGGSATGRYLLYFRGEDFWVYDVARDAHECLTTEVDGAFANREYDYPVEQYPPYGIAGWTDDDEAVLVYDKYDVWRLSPDGSGGERLTAGADEQIVHRYLRLDREAEAIDPDAPLYLRLSGEWTKQTGLARVRMGNPVERLILADKSVTGLVKAEDTDVFAYTVQDADDSPDLFIAGPNLADARQVTETNPFQEDFAWGRSELVNFESTTGRKLQGALLYPPNHDASRQYPMIVYTYEILSPRVHSYVVPSERSYYNFTVFTNAGYFVLLPDIVYRGRDPGRSAVEAVEGAVQSIIDRGLVDPERIGLVGHSWGGYQATYIPTQTDIFAASVAGAPLTNFLSMMGAIHWRPGLPETGHWETGQARMEVPFWEDFEAHVRNSPAAFVHELNTPMLMMFGDDDGTVDWRQGVEFYNYARRAGKSDFVMLVYPGEDHGLRQKKNQVDYQRRILQWFGHYLQGDEAAPWITDGVSFLDRKKALGR